MIRRGRWSESDAIIDVCNKNVNNTNPKIKLKTKELKEANAMTFAGREWANELIDN